MGLRSISCSRSAGVMRLLCAVLVLLPALALAQNKPPAPCRVQLNVAEQSAARLAVRLRTNCPASRDQLKTALAEVRSSAFAAGAQPAELRVDLGRLVDHPWLSTALARAALTSKEWDKAAGKPRQRNINQFAGALLRMGGGLDDLVPGWSLQSVVTEKVLVQPARALPELRTAAGDRTVVPYDAMVWLTYVPTATPEAGPATAVPTVIPPARLDD